jgi:imidazolonepropionase-like amidohydrolase
MDARYRESLRAALRMTKLLYDAGIPIVAGTDDLPGFTLHRELELYVEAGIPAPEVLRIATLGAARVARRDRELGSIAPGKLADVILVEGDPAQRISDIRRTVLVIKDGQAFEPAALYRALGVQP